MLQRQIRSIITRIGRASGTSGPIPIHVASDIGYGRVEREPRLDGSCSTACLMVDQCRVRNYATGWVVTAGVLVSCLPWRVSSRSWSTAMLFRGPFSDRADVCVPGVLCLGEQVQELLDLGWVERVDDRSRELPL
jgi:hypothetical protein